MTRYTPLQQGFCLLDVPEECGDQLVLLLHPHLGGRTGLTNWAPATIFFFNGEHFDFKSQISRDIIEKVS